MKGWSHDKALHDAANIYETVKHILKLAQANSITTSAAASRVAEDRIDAVARCGRLRLS